MPRSTPTVDRGESDLSFLLVKRANDLGYAPDAMKLSDPVPVTLWLKVVAGRGDSATSVKRDNSVVFPIF